MDTYNVIIYLMAICVGFIIITLISFACKLQSNTSILKFYRYTTILYMVSSIFCSLCDIAHVALAQQQDRLLDASHFHIIDTAADVWYFIATVTLYSILIGRLYLTFKETAYKMSKCIMAILIFLITSQILLMVSYCTGLYFWPNCGSETYSCTIIATFLGTMTLCMSIMDFIINTSLLVLFVYKLNKLIKSIKASTDIIEECIGDSPSNSHSILLEDTSKPEFYYTTNKRGNELHELLLESVNFTKYNKIISQHHSIYPKQIKQSLRTN